jgi:hypothetical protein
MKKKNLYRGFARMTADRESFLTVIGCTHLQSGPKISMKPRSYGRKAKWLLLLAVQIRVYPRESAVSFSACAAEPGTERLRRSAADSATTNSGAGHGHRIE